MNLSTRKRNMNNFCDKCNCQVETIKVKRKEVYEVFGENIEVDAEVLVCKQCGSDVFDMELDNNTLKKAYDIYKRNHNLLSSKDIVNLRQKYGLSQRALGKLLGWGDKTIFRYESGSVQNRSHNLILTKLIDEKNMVQYLKENKDSIDSKISNKILKNIDINSKQIDFTFKAEFDYEASLYSGFKEFDFDKTCAMIQFFIEKFGRIQSVKLLKLVNYADMLYFKENSISISGLRYKHYIYGPVPENYDLIFHNMLENCLINESYEIHDTYECHYYESGINSKLDVLDDEEKRILQIIYEKFKNYGSKQISEYSHLEKGYTSTTNNELISYEYALDINFD